MAIFSSFHRKQAFALTAQLCLAGAICGALYALVFFGFGKTLLLLATISGAVIVFFYCLLELFLFTGNFKKETYYTQFGTRVLGYGLLFLIAFSLLSFLHASYTYHTSGDPVQIILAEDYFPYWPNYLLYAFLAAIVFQCFWLLNTVARQNKNLSILKDGEIKKIQSTIFVLALKTTGNKETSEARIIETIGKLLEKIAGQYNEEYLSLFEPNQLKICFLKEFTASELVHLQQIVYSEFQNHISNPEKMLVLQMGFASGLMNLQKCGEHIVFYGEPLIAAEAQLKTVTSATTTSHAALQTTLSVLL